VTVLPPRGHHVTAPVPMGSELVVHPRTESRSPVWVRLESRRSEYPSLRYRLSTNPYCHTDYRWGRSRSQYS
jgi:hypothetical protein